MAVNINNLIAAINPEIFCEPYIEEDGKWISLKDRVKKLGKEKGFLAAAEIAKPKECSPLDFEERGEKNSIYYISPFSLPGLKDPIEKHTLLYDSSNQNLEPIYFWILDSLYQEYKDMKQVDKLIDNFISSPGSGHFSEMGQKSTKMQEEAMKMLGAANQVIKSILNLVYDLKEFRMRLDLYEKLKSKKFEEKQSAILSLKQVWIDTVDMKRGNTSLKALAFGQQSSFVTLIDAFMKANNLKDLESIDLNDRVKRLLQQRVGEFDDWMKESEKELRKRYEIEITYLKSQVNSVHLYARWVKPYLRAARQLEQNATSTAALVTAFNTTIFELTLLGQSEYKPEDEVNRGDLPSNFKSSKLRKYIPLIVIELKFRSIPERAGQQGYGFRGRTELSFNSYALNKEEIEILKKEVEKDDIGDVLTLIEGSTKESLDQLKDDIDSFINERDNKDKIVSKDSNNVDDTNPFSSLFSIFKSSGKKESSNYNEDDMMNKEIMKDTDLEKVIRSQAILKARAECQKFYGLFKKNFGMPAF